MPVPASAATRLIGLRRMFAGELPSNFWKLWGSAVAANLADGVALVAIPLIAVRLTTSPAEVAGVSVAFQLPLILFGLIAGGLADRLDRRWTMVIAQLLRVAVMLALVVAALTGGLSMPVLYAAAFLIGTGEAFFDTNAQSILPAVVGRARLVSANGRLFAAETIMNSFVGPLLGGVLVAIAVSLALSGAALGFGLAALGLLLISGSFRAAAEAPRRALALEIGEGIGYLLRHRLLLTLSAMVALGRLGSAGFFALLALFAVAPGPMGLSEPGYGLLLVSFGAGSIGGSLLTGRAVRWLGRPGVLLVSTAVFALGMLVPALTTNALAVGVGFFVAGAAVMAWNVTNVSLRQQILPSRLMGRVHATHRFLANAAGLIGAFAAGLIAEAFGLQVAFAVGSAVAALGLLGGLVVTDDRIRAAEAEAATPYDVPVARVLNEEPPLP